MLTTIFLLAFSALPSAVENQKHGRSGEFLEKSLRRTRIEYRTEIGGIVVREFTKRGEEISGTSILAEFVTPQGRVKRFYRFIPSCYPGSVTALKVPSEDQFGYLISLAAGATQKASEILFVGFNPETQKALLCLDTFTTEWAHFPAINYEKNGNPLITVRRNNFYRNDFQDITVYSWSHLARCFVPGPVRTIPFDD